MAKIRICCPTCASALEIDEDLLGKEVECGECREIFVAKALAKSRPVTAHPAKGGPDDEPEEPRSGARKRRRDDDDDDYDERRWRRGGRYEERKSRLVYILLALFLGALGVHNFYAGRTSPAAAQLLITAVSIPLMCVFVGFVTIFIPWVWAIIDIVTVERDGNNVPMRG